MPSGHYRTLDAGGACALVSATFRIEQERGNGKEDLEFQCKWSSGD